MYILLSSFQELQGLIDEANQSLEESGTPSHEIMVIVLHREFTAGSIGITLAGGADYENKEITVSINIKSQQQTKKKPHRGRHFQKIYDGF